METGDSVAKGTERALFLLAEKRSEAVFNELLDYASDVCLRRPPNYLQDGEPSTYEQVTPEEKLVQNLGARSLGAILELEKGIHPLLPAAPTDVDESAPDYTPPKRGFHVTDMVADPELFSNPLNLRVLENAERFGQALIDESFSVLGKDADAWVEKLKQAKSEEEEMAVIDWLNARIETIANKSRHSSQAEDESAHFYPPYRISPKFIGSYPNLVVQPSCLSASIIATSFFEKAGKPTLHAGVMAPTQDIGSELTGSILRRVLSRGALQLPEDRDLLLQSLFPLAKATRQWVTRPLAQHGAVYTKLESGWVQFDAYGLATDTLFSDENEHLNELYDTITTWHGVVPNLEFSTSIAPNRSLLLTTPEYGNLAMLLAEYDYGDESESLIQHIAESLTTIPDESYQTYLFDTCLTPLLATRYNPFGAKTELTETMLRSMLEEADVPQEYTSGGFHSPLREVFEKALKRFVHWNESVDEFIQRCAEDPSYRRRRAEDFLTVPMLMGVYLAKEIAASNPATTHMAVDVGSPAMRIGLATLSDFALYDDYPLPASFWITHWPGAASVAENLDNPPASDRDWKLIYNSLIAQSVHPFTSKRNYDKIKSFLSTYGREEDGNEQG